MKPSNEELLTRGVIEVINRDHLAQRLGKGDALRVKLGIDPTAPDLHLGHTVGLRKLRQFQDAGHTAVLIIGDFTARIGDPSGRDKTRSSLSESEVKANAKAYQEQAFRILNPDKTEVRWQSEWFDDFGLDNIIELASKVSTWHLLSHETFAKRKTAGHSLMHHETLYPLLQGYDSVAVRADVELGASEQKFNLITGRLIQKAYGQEPQDVIISPYLLGTDGKEKMSKSVGNTINLTDSPSDIYGKVMSIPDALVVPYFELLTDLAFEALAKVKQEIRNHPRDAKAHLAHLMVEMLHDEPAAQEAEAEFNRVFRDREMPKDIPIFTISEKKLTVHELLIATKLVKSRSEAARLIEQGGVRVNGKQILSPKDEIEVTDLIIQVGKRRFAHATSKGKKLGR